MALTKIRGNTQILDLSVTNTQIAVKDAQNPLGILLSKIEDGELLVKSNGSVPFTAPVSGVVPTLNTHLATKGYVDGVAQGLDIKRSVRVVTQANVILSGTQTVDGVALAAGDRVLVAGQTVVSENGIYTVGTGVWARAEDADNTPAGEVTSGMFTFVEEGTVYASSGWVLTAANPIALGTTDLTFAQFSQAGVFIGGAGLTKLGNTIDVVSANGGIVVSTDNIALTLDGTTLAVGATGLKLADVGAGQVLVGDGVGHARGVTITGDITIDQAGVAVLTAGSVDGNAVANGSLALAKLASGGAGQLVVVGADGVPAYTTLSGDATISATGSLQLGAGSVSTVELADAAVTLAKLTPLAVGQVIIGTTGGTNTAVTLSGDVTITEAGVVVINAATVVRVADIVTREIPTGIVNGINDTFVLAFAPKVGKETVFVNGIMQDSGAGNDYTITADTITMLYALTAGDKIRVSYFK